MEDKIKLLFQETIPAFSGYKGNDMIEDGIIDSLEMMQIISLIEESFYIEIDGDDIIPENFKNINTVVQLVERTLEKRVNR